MSRRRDISPQSRASKLRMDRQPVVARITDPSLPAGKRKEIDNVMKKARASSNDYWDKKLLDIEEKDPNRWRHTGYKKMYIEGDSSSESEREGNFRYNNRYRNNNSRSRSRSRSRLRKTPPLSPPMRRRSPDMRRLSPDPRRPRSPDGRRPRSPDIRRRPRSPPELPMSSANRRKPSRSPRSPAEIRRRTPLSPGNGRRRSPANNAQIGKRGTILPRSKRPPSPPPKACNSRSNSSVSSCSDESCSVCSPKHRRPRSRSSSMPRSRPGPRSPPQKSSNSHTRMTSSRNTASSTSNKSRGTENVPNSSASSSRMRHGSPTPVRNEKYREEKSTRNERNREHGSDRHSQAETNTKMTRTNRLNSPLEDPRLKIRPPEPPEPVVNSKKKKDKSQEKIRTKIKIEGEKRKKHGSSSESEESSDSEGSLPTFTATTRLTLSERFGKMAQWSMDRVNMENMRITKDSTGGALKVMIEEGMESPPRRYSYSPAPAGHFPEELATAAPSGILSWDDVRVRYEYYKSRGYLRDLDLKDYIKWEEWWYRYQEWLKQERYYEFWERQQMQRRRGRKKIPIAQRLN